MTRVLQELLTAREPGFSQMLARLEGASEHPGTDIRLTVELERLLGQKLLQLGLDPADTTGEELYAVLRQRVQQDDERLGRHLAQTQGADTAPHVAVARFTQQLLSADGARFALKTTVGRRLLKKLPPKVTMKALGYRSVDSLLRREPLFAVLAAAWQLEAAHWRKAALEIYRKIAVTDFELRPLSVIAPTGDAWEKLTAALLSRHQQTLLTSPEFAALIFLPLPVNAPPGSRFASLLLALDAVNNVRASSTYLKLYQVRPDIGAYLTAILQAEPVLTAPLLDTPVSWQIIQRYYARHPARFRDDLFAPHIQREDMTWQPVEEALAGIDQAFAFWRRTANLGLTAAPHGAVSLNSIDAALNYCNALPYTARTSYYLQRGVWSELLVRYLKHDAVEQAVLGSLEANLVDEQPYGIQ